MKTKKENQVVTTTPQNNASENVNTGTETITPSKVESLKTFISDFVKEYYKHPHCPAHAMQKLIDELKLEVLLEKAEANMKPEQIYDDAQEILDCGMLLDDNYKKNHDEAALRLSSVIKRHAPAIMQEIENRKKTVDGEKE